MREDGVSEVMGSSMVLLITVGGIVAVLAFGGPLLATSQGLAQAKAVGDDFAGAARDLQAGSGELTIPIHVPGAFSVSSLFNRQSLSIESGTEGYIVGGTCALGLIDWDETTLTFDDACLTDNTSGNCELFNRCLAIDRWTGTHFVPETYNKVGPIVTLDDTDGLFRVSVLDMNNEIVEARGFFFQQDAVVFESGRATAALEGGAFFLDAPEVAPPLVNGSHLMLLEGGGAVTGGGTFNLNLQYGASVSYSAEVQYIEASFKGDRQVAWCFSVTPAEPDCGGTVARASHDAGSVTQPFSLYLQTVEASIGI